jgi:TM2 domain-containing membrane protein YozV
MAGPPGDDPTREESESQSNDQPDDVESAEPIETDDLDAADGSDDPTESEETGGWSDPGESEETSGWSDPAEGDGFEESSTATTASTTATSTTAGNGDEPGPDEQYCSSCGSVIKKRAEICPECGVRQTGSGGSSEKDRTAAGVFALLLGGIGAHKFYLGQNKMGILYLCFFWTGIPAIVGFIEGILYLTKSDEEFQRKYVD